MRRSAWMPRVAALLALLLLVACAATTSEQNRDPSPAVEQRLSEPVTLTIWHSWTGARLSALNSLARKYEQDHPNVRIRLVMQPATDIVRSYSTSVADGTAPQLLLVRGRYIGELAQQQFIAPLGSAIDQATLDRLLPQAVASSTIDEQLMALPLSFDTLALFYDRRRVANPPATFAEAFDLNAAQRDQPPETRPYSFGYYLSLMTTLPYLPNFDGSLLDGQQPVFATDRRDATVRWLDWMRELQANQQAIVSGDYNLVDSAALRGRTLAMIDWAHRRSTYAQIWGADAVGVAPLPGIDAATPPQSVLLPDVLAINTVITSEQRSAAEEFLRFMVDRSSQETLWSRGQILPVDREARIDDSAAPFLTIAGQSQPVAAPLISLWEPLDSMVRSVITNPSLPTADAIDAANAALPSPSP